MADSFLLSWSQDRWKALKRSGELGEPLRVLFGSPHSSAPSLLRYGIAGGDTVFVVGVDAGELLLLSRVRLKEVRHADDYRPPKRALPHQARFGCVNEAGIADEATPLRLDVKVPLPVLQQLRFRNARGQERPFPLAGDRVKSISLQGHFFRMTGPSSAALDRLLAEKTLH